MLSSNYRRKLAYGCIVTAASALIMLFGCATTPRGAFTAASAVTQLVGLLPPDAYLYGSINVERERALADELVQRTGFSGDMPKSALSRTKLLVFAAEQPPSANPPAAEPTRFSLVASGNYPAGLLAFRLDTNSSWKVVGHHPTQWQNSASGLELAVPSRELILLSNGGISGLVARYTSPSPSGLDGWKSADGSAMSVYVPEAAPLLARLGPEAERVPVTRMYFEATPAADSSDYTIIANLTMLSERDARLFSVVFRLLIAGTVTTGNVLPLSLAGAQLAVNGSTITLTKVRMGRAQLVGLLSSLLPRRSDATPGQGSRK